MCPSSPHSLRCAMGNTGSGVRRGVVFSVPRVMLAFVLALPFLGGTSANSAPGDLDTTFVPFECGNGIVECQEACDDSNTVAGDGCSETCRIEHVPCGLIVPGDENADGRVNAQDVILVLAWVFKGGPTPWDCPAIGDVNCSGAVTAADIIYLVYYIFTSGPEPCDPCYSPMAIYCEF